VCGGERIIQRLNRVRLEEETGVDLVCVTPVGGGVEILGQQRVLERDMNACRSSRRRQVGGGDDMRWWVDGRLKDSFPVEVREAVGGGMEAGGGSSWRGAAAGTR
jgi:hypothetical protein